MGSPISPLIANMFMEEFEVKVLSSIPNPPSLLVKVCWWHFCHQQGRTPSGPTAPHQQPGPIHAVHSRTCTTRITTIPGHPCCHWTRQHFQHHSLQKTHMHRSISTLGQQPSHHSKAKCLQHPSTQGQNSFFLTGQIGQGTPTHKDSPTTLPVSSMGPQPVATQVHPPHPAQHHHQQQQQSSRQQQKEHYHSCSLHAHKRWKVQKIVQKERNPSTFQGHQHTKDSTRKLQRQGPQKQSNWYHLSLPMPSHKLPQCLCRRIR